MAEVAFWEVFVLLSFPQDKDENRRHLHLYHVNKNNASFVAKIWIEKNGKKDVSIAYYGTSKIAKKFSSTDEKAILSAITEKWTAINAKLDDFFAGKKLIGVIDLKKQ